MIDYQYNFEFPNTKKNICFRDITTEEQINLAKARLTFLEKTDYLKYIINFFSNISKNHEDLLELDYCDFLMFIIKSRILSVNQTIKFKTIIDKQNVNFELDLNELLYNLNGFKFNGVYKDDLTEIEIEYGFPLIKHFNLLENFNGSESMFLDIVHLFIKKINGVSFSSEMKVVLDKLPIRITKKLQIEIFSFLKRIGDYNFLNIKYFPELKFNIFGGFYQEFIKILTLYDIKTIYEEIYILSKLNPNYILKISPADRSVFLSIHIEKIKNMNENNSPLENMMNVNNY
jgi:hypothetical protein